MCGGEDVGEGAVEPHNQARAMLVEPSLQVLGIDTTFPMHLTMKMEVKKVKMLNEMLFLSVHTKFTIFFE